MPKGKKNAAAPGSGQQQQQEQQQPTGGIGAGGWDYAREVQSAFAECALMLNERISHINAQALRLGVTPVGGGGST